MKNSYTKRFTGYVLKYKRLLIISFIFLLIYSVIASLIPFLVKQAIDNFIANKNITGLTQFSVEIAILICIQYLTRISQIYLTNLAGQRTMNDIRMDLFKRLEDFKIDIFNKEPSGKIITRITNDVENLNELLTSGVIALLGDALLIITSIAFLMYINPLLALISITPLPIAFFCAIFFGNRMERLYEKVRDIITKMNIHMQESLTGITIIQSFGAEASNSKKFQNIAKDFRSTFHRAQMHVILLRQSINVTYYSSMILLIIFGGIFTLQGRATAGTIIGFLSYLHLVFGPLGDLSDRFSVLQNAISSMKKIDEFITSNEIEEFVDNKLERPIEGNVVLQDVNFSYEGDSFSLKNVNMQIKKGEKVAIVGFTGAGKSTIANLILGFYKPDSGKIEIDGMDIETMNIKELRKNSAIVLQNIFIFNGTVRDNITLGRTDISDEKIIEASKKIGVHDFIMRLSQGYDTELSTEGKNISVGERQLISFTRALVYDPKILILDEATAALDSDTEELIEKGIRELMKNRTSIVIAHRLSTIKNSDRIYVVNKGKVVEYGTHPELMKKKGLYFEFYTTQFQRI